MVTACVHIFSSCERESMSHMTTHYLLVQVAFPYPRVAGHVTMSMNLSCYGTNIDLQIKLSYCIPFTLNSSP